MVLERDVRLAVQRPKILVTRRLPQAVEERMAALFEAQFNQSDAPYSAQALIGATRDRDHEVRVAAATALDHIGTVAVLEALAPGGGRPSSERRNGIGGGQNSVARKSGSTPRAPAHRP